MLLFDLFFFMSVGIVFLHILVGLFVLFHFDNSRMRIWDNHPLFSRMENSIGPTQNNSGIKHNRIVLSRGNYFLFQHRLSKKHHFNDIPIQQKTFELARFNLIKIKGSSKN